jgi:hypothetical protein
MCKTAPHKVMMVVGDQEVDTLLFGDWNKQKAFEQRSHATNTPFGDIFSRFVFCAFPYFAMHMASPQKRSQVSSSSFREYGAAAGPFGWCAIGPEGRSRRG